MRLLAFMLIGSAVSVCLPCIGIAASAAVDAQNVEFLVHLPLRRQAELEALVISQATRSSPLYHHFLTPAQFRAAYGPAPEAFASAARSLRSSGLTVASRTSQFLIVRGGRDAVQRAFRVPLQVRRTAAGARALATPATALRIPDTLRALGATIHGLTAFPAPRSNARAVPASGYGSFGDYWFDDIKQAYAFPAYGTYTGAGISIATVGLSDFSDADAAMYFGHERLGADAGSLAPAPAPDHYTLPGSLPFATTSNDSFEADLDVQQAAGIAPGATVTNIAAPAGAGEGFLFAYSIVDETNFASIVSTSYGDCELFYTAAYAAGTDQTAVLRAYHDLFLQGNAQGITFIVSSGDHGGRECPPPSYFNGGPGLQLAAVPSVQYWADDPNVTAVGGSDLATSFVRGSRHSAYSYETAYANPLLPEDRYGTGNQLVHDVFGSGGGGSVIWPKPAYQQLVDTGTAGRAVPDIAMQMGSCPSGSERPCHPGASATVEAFGGALVGAVGTSVAAPEFAGLLAVFAQAQGGVRFGNINPYIYELAAANATGQARYYHQYIPGWNGLRNYDATLRYDLITGVGTPVAGNWLLLPFAPPAGDPETASNP